MKLSLEATTKLLPKIQGFGDFDWVSFPRTLSDSSYLDFFSNSSVPRIISMGNGKGEPELKKTREMWEKLGGKDIIISPDFVGDHIKTITTYDIYCQEYGAESVIGVLQGSSYKEVLSCMNYYKGQVAVPFNIGSTDSATNSMMALRRALVVSNIPSDRYVHLLGFNNIPELEWYETKPNVISINTGHPILLGLKEQDILSIDNDSDKSENTFDAMDVAEATCKGQLSQTQWTAIVRNIALLRRYIS